MTKGRLEAFSDGVLAIIITIMVLEFKVPENSSDFSALVPMLPKLISYILSFAFVGIYWNNHHHLLQMVNKIKGHVLWANLFLLFALSFLPFTTAWMGENHFDKNPVALYGINLVFCSIAFTLLEKSLIQSEGNNSKLKNAVKNQRKEYISMFLYISGVAISFFIPTVSAILYGIVAIMWLIPDRRMEKNMD